MTEVLVAVAALVVMEPVTALVHRFVMHGFGMGWHRSHHEAPRRALEANDLFPVVFAAATIVLLAIGVSVSGAPSLLVPIGIGVTAYGAAYLLVHDVVIHRRIAFLPVPDALLRPWREAHNVHHLFARAPYGFLAPVVPSDLRRRAVERGVDRTRRTVSAAPA
ncbi:MAG TPA: sterol desaturase family protein [Acidimicrobiia bacterium]|nr:sterol desaturase family protein [Acidimicrobiia bacterium]